MFSENIGDSLTSIFHGPRPVPGRSGRMITSRQCPFFGILGPHGLYTYPIVFNQPRIVNTRYGKNNRLQVQRTSAVSMKSAVNRIFPHQYDRPVYKFILFV